MKYVVIAGIVILIGFIIALHFIPIGIEPLTEVYFENHTILPAHIFLGTYYNYSFSVHNLEYGEMNYTYNISNSYNNISQSIDSGNFMIGNNQTITFEKSFMINQSFDRAQITVNVTKDTNESIDIDFWVDQATQITIKIENVTNKTG